MSALLSSMVALLPGMILIFGLIAVFCVLLFDTRPHGGTKIVRKCNKSGKTEYYIYNVVTNPNVTQEGTEFDTADLLAKLAKEISPNSNVYLKISPKKRILPGTSSEEDPSHNTWHVQMKTNALEDSSSDEESYVLTCEKVNDNCFLMTYTDQNEPTVQNLQDILWFLLETFCGTSQKTGYVRSTNVSRNRKTKRAAKARPRRQQKQSQRE
ncbi:uncharacterized protein LOC114061889 [Empidonax traillii]|uniref:uncharacterized protein LOC114061889 n=1 Tax=Empidonax traillii TaxID=164674 RepID=UPI000FFD5188|nr:uncharacterized protein LOC114061889 [Empidonax traillii]